jgi:hypothetical protein
MIVSGGRTEETARIEVKLASDGRRLLLILWLTEGTNFWVHPDGKYSFVPTERDIITLKLVYEAIDKFNQEQMAKKILKL